MDRFLAFFTDAEALVDGEDDVLLARRLEQCQPREGQHEQDDHDHAAAQREDALPAGEIGQAAVKVPRQQRDDEQAE